jgi:hypothetical protein
VTMHDSGALLHNMSAPPKSVVKYSGLTDLATHRGPRASRATGIGSRGNGVFGTPVRFALPASLAGKSSAAVLGHLGVDAEADPELQLCALIDVRANELPLPDGCAVITALKEHRLIWADALSALAILAKCSESVWLRAKTPSLNAARARTQVTLLVPPLFADRLPKESA